MTNEDPHDLLAQITTASRIVLFLDYDGTLADFALTPDQIDPSPEVIALLTRLAHIPQLRVIVLSGRRLGHIQALLPVPHILLAGTYGLEMQLPDGKHLDRAQLSTIRPTLDHLKLQWTRLIAGRVGFYLEDKVWALALHAKYAEEGEAQQILKQAADMATGVITSSQFRCFRGHRFFEAAPLLANKGIAVKHLLEQYEEPGLLPIYLGDDAMDEEAFAVVKTQGGIAILVAAQPRATHATHRLDSPTQTRHWLSQLAGLYEKMNQAV